MIHFNYKRGDFIYLPDNVQEKTKILLKENSNFSETLKSAKEISEKYRNNNGSGSERFVKTKQEALAYAISRMPATFGAIYSAMGHSLDNLNKRPKKL